MTSTTKDLAPDLASEEITRSEPEIEAMAEKIYLSKYAKDGGRWECVETKDVWREKAREYFRANDFWAFTMGIGR